MGNDLYTVEDKVFIITGGLGQLGKMYTDALLSRGSRCIIIDKPDIKDVKVSKYANKNNFLYMKCDITKKNQLRNSLKIINEKWGVPVDVLINNAALDSPPDAPLNEVGPFEEYSEEAFDRIMDVNVKGSFLCCQIFGKDMMEKNGGIIINISSIYGMLSPRQDVYSYTRKAGRTFNKPIAYSVSKSAIHNLTRYLATYWAKKNIRVNTLTLAGVYNDQPKEFLDSYTKHIPIGRMANADEIVGPIIFLSSQASSYMTGGNLVIDGGWTAW